MVAGSRQGEVAVEDFRWQTGRRWRSTATQRAERSAGEAGKWLEVWPLVLADLCSDFMKARHRAWSTAARVPDTLACCRRSPNLPRCLAVAGATAPVKKFKFTFDAESARSSSCSTATRSTSGPRSARTRRCTRPGYPRGPSTASLFVKSDSAYI